MEKIKVLHIQETIASGGVERRRLSLAKLLDKNVFDQKIICCHSVGNIANEIMENGTEVIPIGNLDSPLHWSQHKKVQKIISEYKPHIIHGAVFEGVTMATINGFIKKVPIIIIEETSDPKNRSWKGNLLMKFFSKFVNKIIAVSPIVAEEYLFNKLHLSKNKVIVINNGVKIPRKVENLEIENVKIKLGISENDFIIGSVGRMIQDEHKRFSDLLKAFAKFSENKSNCRLLLVGEGKEKIKYMKLAKELNIFEKTIFVGYQSDTTLYYRLMNVFALVSAYEAFGLVLAEAMLNKLPVIATKVGGMKSIVDDGETGLLVEKYNIESINKKMEILYHDEILRKEMGRNGYKKAMKEYTEEVYVEKISNLNEELLNGKKI